VPRPQTPDADLSDAEAALERSVSDRGRVGWKRVVTAPVFLARHLMRLLHIERSTDDVQSFSRPAPSIDSVDPDVQPPDEGVGDLVMRTYAIDLIEPELDADELLARIAARPNDFCSALVAGFVADGEPAVDLRIGDDVLVDIPGPWTSRVRVVRISPAIHLLTLDGHIEAGHVVFDTTPLMDGDDTTGGYTFRVTSWARPGDRVFEILHVRLGVAWEVQTAMWLDMCVRAHNASGARNRQHLTVRSERLVDADGCDATRDDHSASDTERD